MTASVNVSIPGGVVSGNVLRLQGMGHFMGSMMGMEQCSDVLLSLEVSPLEGLSLSGSDVIFTLPLTLCQAVSGVELSVPTIQGEQNVVIPPLSRHKEEVIMSGLGVSGTGNQRVILDVSYPDNISAILSETTLSQNEIN